MSASDSSDRAAGLTPVNPFYALRYHFGMLLGVEDFETEQAYHRGKSRLHNAWLHGAGVIWGLGVTIDGREVQVAPGLALDAAGRELHLDRPHCLDLERWAAENRTHPDLPSAAGDDERVRFPAYVVARFRPCLARPVPALSEPCAGAQSDTAYSRVIETLALELSPTRPAEADPAGWPRVNLLCGLVDPRMDEGVVIPADQAVLDARAALASLSGDARARACVEYLRHFAALDASEHGPPPVEDEQRLFPGGEDPCLVLGVIDELVFSQGPLIEGTDLPSWRFESATAADITKRSTLLPTALLQTLDCHAHAPPSPPTIAAVVTDPTTLQVDLGAVMLAGTVSSGAFTVSVRLEDAAAPWIIRTVANAAPAGDGSLVDLTLDGDLDADHAGEPLIVRVVARGTGAAPLLDADLAPLGGDAGRDLFTHLRWTRGA